MKNTVKYEHVFPHEQWDPKPSCPVSHLSEIFITFQPSTFVILNVYILVSIAICLITFLSWQNEHSYSSHSFTIRFSFSLYPFSSLLFLSIKQKERKNKRAKALLHSKYHCIFFPYWNVNAKHLSYKVALLACKTSKCLVRFEHSDIWFVSQACPYIKKCEGYI